MTVVIMASCVDRSGDAAMEYIVGACDDLLSGDLTSFRDERVAKIQKPGTFSKWLVGYSGEPEHFPPIRDALFSTFSPTHGVSRDVEAALALKALQEAYNARRKEVIQQEVLALSLFADFEDFNANGLLRLGQKEYSLLRKQIRDFDLGITLMMAGFSTSGPEIMTIAHPGRARSHFAGSCGAQAIGAGQFHAQFHLNACYSRDCSLAHAVYRVLEAKMLADETVRSVGKDTILFVMDLRGEVRMLTSESLEMVRAIWEKHRKEVPEIGDALDFFDVMNIIGPMV